MAKEQWRQGNEENEDNKEDKMIIKERKLMSLYISITS